MVAIKLSWLRRTPGEEKEETGVAASVRRSRTRASGVETRDEEEEEGHLQRAVDKMYEGRKGSAEGSRKYEWSRREISKEHDVKDQKQCVSSHVESL